MSTTKSVYCGQSDSRNGMQIIILTGDEKKFTFNQKQEQDSQKVLDNPFTMIHKGLMGGLTNAFMGQGFVHNRIADTGQDQPAIDNMNPLVEMKLKMMPAVGMAFETTARTMTTISRIAVRPSGDPVNFKYNPADLTQIFVVSKSYLTINNRSLP